MTTQPARFASSSIFFTRAGMCLILTGWMVAAFGMPAWAGVRQVIPVGTTCDPNTDASFIEQEAECVGTAVQRPAFQFGTAVAACASDTAGLTQWTGSVLQYCNGTSWVTLASNSITLGSLTTANPFISGDATSGFYTAGAAKVDVGISGSKVTEWTSSGVTVTGTAAANSFIPTSSTLPTNGMYLPAANSLGFTTSGTVALTITTTQSVGIGTTAPPISLTVDTTSSPNYTGILAAGIAYGTSYFSVEHSNGTQYSGGIASVGPGNDTTAPFHAAVATIANSKNYYSLIGMRKRNSVWTINSALSTGDYLPGIGFAGQTNGTAGTGMILGASILGIVDNTVSSGNLPSALVFHTSATNAAGLTERMRISSAGSVGIGTTSPAAPLTVAPPASETVAAGATITANGCSTLKPVTSTAARSTSTTDAFTNATAAGCCMTVQNVGSFTITLKHSANFKTSGGTDISLTSGSFVPVCSDGSIWYQTAALITPS